MYITRVFIDTEALKAMEKVASHINEMQKIYEDYGAVFDQLVAEQSGSEKEVLHFLTLPTKTVQLGRSVMSWSSRAPPLFRSLFKFISS